MNIFLLTSLLFVTLAIFTAIDSASTSFELLPFFFGLRWLRVHFITLGILTESLFGLLPVLVAARANRPRPRSRLDIWLILNAGFLTLLVGVPLINRAMLILGGALVFAATLLLLHQLLNLRPQTDLRTRLEESDGRKFYTAGALFFLLGIFVGTGFWLGWNELLGMRVPIEVHIHANNWGLFSMVFAGLLIELYPQFAGRSLAWPQSVDRIFWLMALGTTALIIGPWTGLAVFTAAGILLHLTATVWLLANIVSPLRGDRLLRTPGMLHLITAYAWIVAPILVAPLILLGVRGFPGAGIEQNVPQALIYGWALQFGFAMLPYLFRRVLWGPEHAKLGGSWFSLITVHLGATMLWASIFIRPYQTTFHGAAYVLWFLSMLPFLGELWQIARDWISGDRWPAQLGTSGLAD